MFYGHFIIYISSVTVIASINGKPSRRRLEITHCEFRHQLLLKSNLVRLSSETKTWSQYVTNNSVTTECTPNASNANSIADEPPLMAVDRLAVVPSEAKSRFVCNH